MKVSTFLVPLFVLTASAAEACPRGTESRGVVNGVERCALRGTYLSSEIRLTADKEYLLEDGVFLGDDNKNSSVLRIEAGTKILGNPGSFLAVLRGSKIYAEGTAQKPILFSSVNPGPKKRGEWGGIVLNGNAPINACAAGAPVCEAVSEGIKSREVKFGGNDPADDSGVLRYVVVEFGGYPIAVDNELNGITFNGVGSSTVVEYIQVNMNSDDGIEMFGGTVDLKHVVLTNNEDDSMDWDHGWTGRGQFILIDQGKDQVDTGFESDNLQSPMNAQPRSNPVLSNVTMIGSGASGYGMLLRRGTGAQLSNFIVTGFKKACIDIDDSETFANGANVAGGKLVASGLTMTHSVLNCAKAFEIEAGDAWSVSDWFTAQAGNQIVDPQLNGWMPKSGSALLTSGQAPDDFFFEMVDFIGAMGSEDWTAGWVSKRLQ